MAEYKFKIEAKTEKPNITAFLVVEIHGSRRLATKVIKEIDQLADAEEWEIY